MSSRTAYPGTAATNDVLTAANVNNLPGGWIGYVEVTANQGSIGGTFADLTGLSQAVTVNTTRRLKLTGKTRFSSDTAGDQPELAIRESTTQLQSVKIELDTAGGPGGTDVTVIAIITPTSGSHTYKLSAQRSDGSGTITSNAAAGQPAFLLIEDIGPAS